MNELLVLLPEILLILTLAGTIASEIGYHGEKIRVVSLTAIFGLLAALLQMVLTYNPLPAKILNDVLVFDGVSYFFRFYFVFLTLLVSLVSLFSKEILPARRPEYYVFLISSALALCMISSSADLLVLFLSFQFLNLVSYFLSGYSKHQEISTEAATKLFVFTVVAGAMFLYASAILFSATGTLNVYEIREVLAATPLPLETSVAVFILLFLSLSFYLGVFPMYLWVPDVLEGSPTPTTVFLWLALPAAGFAVAIRFFAVIFQNLFLNLQGSNVIALAAGLTMMAGALLALRQKRAKRMLVCLLVSQSGYLMCGLLVLDKVGISALLYNLLVMLFSVVGLFCAFSHLFDALQTDRLDKFRGVMGRAIPECICLILFFACFLGFPPMPGFIGKFVLLGSMIQEHWYILSLIVMASTILTAVSFVKLTFSLAGDFREPISPSYFVKSPQRIFLILLLVPVAGLSIFASVILQWATRSAELILW